MSPAFGGFGVAAGRFPRVSGDEPLDFARREVEGRGFPRVSGDEPQPRVQFPERNSFSPRERG